MAGNERVITEFLVRNKGKLILPHLGTVQSIASPVGNGFIEINTLSDVTNVMTEDPSKKADIYINNHGVSLKQTGASFPYNMLQCSELLATFQYLDLSNPELTLDKIDSEVRDFHDGKIQDRSRQWIGQIRHSEHTRALSIANKAGNEPWVFKDISALPRPRDGKLWRDDIPESDRREVYFLSIEKV